MQNPMGEYLTKKELHTWLKDMESFAAELLRRPTKRAVDLGWTCGKCGCSNAKSDLLCGFCDTPRPSH